MSRARRTISGAPHVERLFGRRLAWETHGAVSCSDDCGGIRTSRFRKAHAFWCNVQGRNVRVDPGIAAAMAHLPFAGQKDIFFGTMHGQGSDAVQFVTDPGVVITRLRSG